MRTVHDPFEGKDVQISDRLVDRLRGKYASGPHLPNGNPEFGWRQFQSPPIQHEAAKRIEELEARVSDLERTLSLRDAATESLCIAIHGEAVAGKSIYELIFDADRMARAARKSA